MKRKLFALPFVLILLIALAACSGGKDSSKQAGTSKSGTPKDGGTLTIGVSDNPETMNPLYANDACVVNCAASFICTAVSYGRR